MICVYLKEIPKNCENDFLKDGFLEDSFPKTVIQRIKNTKDERTLFERIYAYENLLSALESCGISKDTVKASFRFGKFGKPYLKGDFNLSFSVSHTDGVVAALISDSSSCGIDVEKITDEKIASVRRAKERFFNHISLKGNLKEQISCFISSENGFMEYDYSDASGSGASILKEAPEYNDFLLWTLCEAELKCDGGGFSSLPQLSEIMEKTEAKSFVLTLSGGLFAITAVRK
jgi:phosphopantetheinyl transferase